MNRYDVGRNRRRPIAAGNFFYSLLSTLYRLAQPRGRAVTVLERPKLAGLKRHVAGPSFSTGGSRLKRSRRSTVRPLRGRRRPTSFRFMHRDSCKTRDLSDGSVPAGRHLTGRGLPSLLNVHYLCIYLYYLLITWCISSNTYKYYGQRTTAASRSHFSGELRAPSDAAHGFARRSASDGTKSNDVRGWRIGPHRRAPRIGS